MLVSLLLAAQISWAETEPPDLLVRRADSGHLLVEVAIAGQDAGWWAFDTGAEEHVLHHELAEQLRLPKLRDAELLGTVESASGSVHSMTGFEVGPATWAAARCVAVDLTALRERLGEPIGGILGFRVLQDLVVRFDYRNDAIRFVRPEDFEAPEELVWERIVDDRKRPAVRVRFEGRRTRMLLDTGAIGGALFYKPAITRFDLLDDRETQSTSSGGIFGSGEYQSGRLAWLELGGHRFEEPVALFDVEGHRKQRNPSGLLGVTFFWPHVVWFDMPRDRVGFESLADLTLDEVQREALVGRYRGRTGEVQVETREDQVWAEINGRWRRCLAETPSKLFLADGPGRFWFELDPESGSAAQVTFLPRVHPPRVFARD